METSETGTLEPAGDTSRAVVVHPVLKSGPQPRRTVEARLEEAVGLARAIGLDVVASRASVVQRPQAATLLGSGGVEEIGALAVAEGAGLVIVDHALSPIQQRNLERRWKVKVIDRSGLILEIFGERARTAEGKLQVELAHLTYQRSRLVRSWTHLERQRGGRGFLGGPGESQMELDRRAIDDRIVHLKRELEEVRRTRSLHRQARSREQLPTVALVGYTNAGKSTLFNRMTRAEVLAQDMLFATLDPTMRAAEIGGGRKVIVSDTVGFISDLPHNLVAAFRATLEEVQTADVILHVRDVAHEDTEAQRTDVLEVLAELGIDGDKDPRLIEVLNKTDLLDGAAGDGVSHPGAVRVSALTGAGMPDLLAAIAARLEAGREVVDLSISLADGGTLAWVHAHGRVLERRDDDSFAHLRVSLPPEDASRLARRMARNGDAPAA